MNQQELTTERLILRSFNVSDAADVHRMAGNFNVAKITLNIPHSYEDGMAEEWINSHPKMFDAGVQLSYAITSKDSGALIGAIGLTHIEESQANLGYWIDEPYWGNGYCAEAGMELIKYAFDQLKLKKVYALHLTSNPASGRVMQKMKMKHHSSEQRPDRCGKPASVEFYTIKCT